MQNPRQNHSPITFFLVAEVCLEIWQSNLEVTSQKFLLLSKSLQYSLFHSFLSAKLPKEVFKSILLPNCHLMFSSLKISFHAR